MTVCLGISTTAGSAQDHFDALLFWGLNLIVGLTIILGPSALSAIGII